MKNRLIIAAAIACGLGLLTAEHVNAALLSVDFGNAGAEPGFVQQNSTNQTHSTGSGDVTIQIAGQQGLFDFATSGTNDLLYRDFFFKNGGIITMTISGPGIDANTPYDMTFWAYYGNESAGRDTYFAAGAATTGVTTATIADSDSPAPSSLLDPLYSVSGTFTSDNSGVLTISVESERGRPVINAVELTAVPEPTSFALLGLGGLLIARRRRD